MSVYCSLVVCCWERADLVTFSCAFVTFSCGVLGQLWYFFVSIPNICLLSYLSKEDEKLNSLHIGQCCILFLLSADFLAHLSRRFIGELIVYQ